MWGSSRSYCYFVSLRHAYNGSNEALMRLERRMGASLTSVARSDTRRVADVEG